MPKSFRTPVLSVLTTCALVFVAAQAQAQSIIKRPGAHPNYSFEAEPHLVLRDNTGDDGSGIGPGFRGTIVVVDQGFIGKINNSVGIGFGLDWLALGDEHCHGNTGNGDPNDDHCHDPSEIVLPVVMQWNFWLHRKWSVFGEPGLALVFDRDDDDDDWDDDDDDLDINPFVFYAGGRFHFSDTVTLTMRLGFPVTLSVGVSFLL